MVPSLRSIGYYVNAGLAATAPPSHACGDVIREAQNGIVLAQDVYDCYTSIPFNGDVATRLVNYWNLTLQFQSTLEYLKNPPESYQKPGIDLDSTFGDILTSIDAGDFDNQYDFEAVFQNVLHSTGDVHVSFDGGAMSAFGFGSPAGLTSVSIDGMSLPQVYFTDDLKLNQTDPSPTWRPSPVKYINGYDSIDYLTTYAAINTPGTIDYDTDWNMLFDSPANDLDPGNAPLWVGGAQFFPDDHLNYTFENGSTYDGRWLAVYKGPLATGPLETGGDFYNFFVLGLYPAACNSTSPPLSCPFANMTDSDTSDSAAVLSSPSDLLPLPEAYPEPNIVANTTGLVMQITGYFLHDESLAVLSLPTFLAYGDGILNYVGAVQQFLSQAKELGMTKVIVDLQQNQGGDTLLPYMVFRQFFPSIEPYAGSKARAQDLGNFMGNNTTPYWQNLSMQHPDNYFEGSANQWIAVNRLNATTGSNFTSWAELYGPYSDGTDDFNAVERLDVSDEVFVRAALGNPKGLDDLMTAFDGEGGFAAEDIIMLSDGLCSSACALFMEMMHNDAGVQNIVLGGRPETGPMQTPAGSRAAQEYPLTQLDDDIYTAAAIAQAKNEPVPDIVLTRNLQSVFYTNGGISLRSQVRKGKTIPLEMEYQAADCRLYYMPTTFNNFTNLWRHAAAAAWKSADLCVEDSTGWQDVIFGNGSTKPLPNPGHPKSLNYTSQGIPWLAFPGGYIPFTSSTKPDFDAGAIFSYAQADFHAPQTPRLASNSLQYVVPKAWKQLSPDQTTVADTQWQSIGDLNRNQLLDGQSQYKWTDHQMLNQVNNVYTRDVGRPSNRPWSGGGDEGRGGRRRRALRWSRASKL